MGAIHGETSHEGGKIGAATAIKTLANFIVSSVRAVMEQIHAEKIIDKMKDLGSHEATAFASIAVTVVASILSTLR